MIHWNLLVVALWLCVCMAGNVLSFNIVTNPDTTDFLLSPVIRATNKSGRSLPDNILPSFYGHSLSFPDVDSKRWVNRECNSVACPLGIHERHKIWLKSISLYVDRSGGARKYIILKYDSYIIQQFMTHAFILSSPEISTDLSFWRASDVFIRINVNMHDCMI